jgi:hypothetical protein
MFNKLGYIFCSFILSLIFVLIFTNDANSQSDNVSYTTFSNATIGVSFEYPMDWSIMEFPMSSEDDFHFVRIGSPDGKSEILVSIYLSENPQETTQQNLALAISFATRDEFKYNKSSELDLNPFHTILDTWKLSTNETSENEQGKYYFGNDDERAFEIYYVDKKKNYEANYFILDHIKDSFKLSKIEPNGLQFRGTISAPESKKDFAISTNKLNPSFSVYENKIMGMSMEYPSNWTEEGEPNASSAMFVSPDGMTSMSITSYDNEGLSSVNFLNDYVERVQIGMETLGYDVVNSQRGTDPSDNQFIETMHVDDIDNLRMADVYTMNKENNRVYIISYLATESIYYDNLWVYEKAKKH